MLTARERQLALALVSGRPVREIASSLNVAVSTVRSHIKSVYAKLDVSSRTQLIVLYEGDASRLDRAVAAVGDQLGLTAAERSLVSHLARGLPLRAVQVLCRVAESTLRTHLKASFAKTRTRNQAELVHLIWTLVPDEGPVRPAVAGTPAAGPP